MTPQSTTHDSAGGDDGAAGPAGEPENRGRRVLATLPGLTFVAAISALGIYLGRLPWVKANLHVSALLIVILLGMAVKSIMRMPAVLEPGTKVAQKPILRWGVAFLGFTLSFASVAALGFSSLAIVVICALAATFFGWWIALQIGMGEKFAMLLGCGGAICGASAIVAADSVVEGDESDVAYTLGIITLLGTIAILIYPILGRLLHMDQAMFGVWSGTSIHETAQVIAAASSFDNHPAPITDATALATTVKLARICMLAPIVLLYGGFLKRKYGHSGKAKVALLPWFLVLFLIFGAINSFILQPGFFSAAHLGSLMTADQWNHFTSWVLSWAKGIMNWLLAMGMCGIGLHAGFHDLRRAGFKPILAGALQWAFLAGLSYALILALQIHYVAPH